MKIVGETVILDNASIFCLVLRYDAVGGIIDALCTMHWFASAHVLSTFGPDNFCRDSQARCSVDTSLSPMIMLFVGLQRLDFVSQEKGRVVACVCNERL